MSEAPNQEVGKVAERARRVDLIIEGSGVKGYALVGALSVLEEHGFEPQNVAGTSVGAVIATLLSAGYTTQEINFSLNGLYSTVSWDDDLKGYVSQIGTPLSVLKEPGDYEGFLSWMGDLLEAKGVRTFGDLIRRPETELRYRYKLQVIVSDLTEQRLLVLPRDAYKLGIDDPDDFEVAQAVRMSMSLPISFGPVRFLNPQTGGEHLIVDGGVLSNFPIWLFDAEEPLWPTFGLALVEPNYRATIGDRLPQVDASSSDLLISFASAVQAMIEMRDRLYMATADFARTITIPTRNVRAMDFHVPMPRMLELYELGRAAAVQFLETWTFEGYVAEFRHGKQHSRRQEVAEQMQRAAES